MRIATDAVLKTIALLGVTATSLLFVPADAMGAVGRARTSARPAAAAGVSSPPAASPVRLRVEPDEASLRWSYVLENNSGAPIDLVADRRLIWLEVTAAPNAAPTVPPARGTRASRTRASATPRCTMPSRPRSNDASPHGRLGANEQYTEIFDLRELCGAALERTLTPGASVTFHYGYGTTGSADRAVVLDGSTPPVIDLVAPAVTVPGTTGTWPPPVAEAQLGDPRLRVVVPRSAQAATLSALTIPVRITLAHPYPLYVFYRPGQIGFDVTGPDGAHFTCRGGQRNYAPMREWFVRLRPGGSVGSTLQLGVICDPGSFATAGVYRVQAIFDSRVSGAQFGFNSFEGVSASPYFVVRITRGQRPGPLRRMSRVDPFVARPTNQGDAGAPAP